MLGMATGTIGIRRRTFAKAIFKNQNQEKLFTKKLEKM